ncbi:hypothetical protein D3C83_96380 [compost metagenome]
MLGRHFTEGCQNRLDQKLSRAGNARADMAVIIGQTLVVHNAVAQGNFLFELISIFSANFHRSVPFHYMIH